jgi:hypothetical protein
MMMPGNNDIVQEVLKLRQEGLSDNLINEELARKGANPQQIQDAINQADIPPPPGGGPMPMMQEPMPAGPAMGQGPDMPPMGGPRGPPASVEGNIYERIEEITEGMIDEKWDELIGEVKKIIDWKEKIEVKQIQMISDLEKLKEDFKTLHHGVLGKLEDYDHKMQDVGTELKAVGKVFKDVVPEFVENVKELRDIKDHLKR